MTTAAMGKSMDTFFQPTKEHLTKLSQPWCCSYSGGKDSTSLVTWIEWLRRSGWLTVERPRLVQSDTTVEYQILTDLSNQMMDVLRKYGWECVVVEPKIHEKLYNRILGIGNTPIHPGIRSMRWCTRSTKIDPMKRWKNANKGGLNLTGVRLGESKMRDGKLTRKLSGCSAGGECGLPDPDDNNYAPIIHWRTCNVVEWLWGVYWDGGIMDDILPITRKLMDIYQVEVDRDVLDFAEPEITAARFGCIGRPAIEAGRNPPRSVVARHGKDSPLNELYDVWFEARRRINRCWRWHPNVNRTRNYGFGPVKMAVRKKLFRRVMDIQKRAGIVLISPEDTKFIRKCWKNKVYPRGWSEADEATEPPVDCGMFSKEAPVDHPSP